METFMAIASDQWVIASLALVAFSFFALLAYVFNEERKSRIRYDPNESDGWPQ